MAAEIFARWASSSAWASLRCADATPWASTMSCCASRLAWAMMRPASSSARARASAAYAEVEAFSSSDAFIARSRMASASPWASLRSSAASLSASVRIWPMRSPRAAKSCEGVLASSFISVSAFDCWASCARRSETVELRRVSSTLRSEASFFAACAVRFSDSMKESTSAGSYPRRENLKWGRSIMGKSRLVQGTRAAPPKRRVRLWQSPGSSERGTHW